MGSENVVAGVDALPVGYKAEQSGDLITDALIGGYKFETDADGLTWISYSFPDQNSSWSTRFYNNPKTDEPFRGLSPVSEKVEASLENAMAQLSRLTGLEFVEVPDSGDSAGTIRTAWTHQPGGHEAWAAQPQDGTRGSDIWLNSAQLNEHQPHFDWTIFHELAHGLGLKHTFDQEVGFDFPIMPDKYDGLNYSVMAYDPHSAVHQVWSADLYPQTYMYADILTLQHLYGADMETSAGDEMYQYDLSQRHHLTIWDAGGNDTFAVSNGDKSVAIDLTPGTWSDVGTHINYMNASGLLVGFEKKTIFIMPDTVIENAIGAGGDDVITGNDAANRLEGNEGADTLSGGKASDTLLGGAGDDALWAGKGDDAGDIVDGGTGNDTIGGGAGDDTLTGGEGADVLFGGTGNDTLAGQDWADGAAATTETNSNALWGGDGNDLVVGADGTDNLGGGIGNDTLMGQGGNDVLYGGKNGNDNLDGGLGNDVLYAGIGNDIARGGDGADEIYGGAGTDSIAGDAGDDTLYGGAGDDTLEGAAGADTFYFAAGHGADVVKDFDITKDSIDISSAGLDFTDILGLKSNVSEATFDGISGLLIATGDQSSVFIEGLTMADLTQVNVVF